MQSVCRKVAFNSPERLFFLKKKQLLFIYYWYVKPTTLLLSYNHSCVQLVFEYLTTNTIITDWRKHGLIPFQMVQHLSIFYVF